MPTTYEQQLELLEQIKSANELEKARRSEEDKFSAAGRAASTIGGIMKQPPRTAVEIRAGVPQAEFAGYTGGFQNYDRTVAGSRASRAQDLLSQVDELKMRQSLLGDQERSAAAAAKMKAEAAMKDREFGMKERELGLKERDMSQRAAQSAAEIASRERIAKTRGERGVVIGADGQEMPAGMKMSPTAIMSLTEGKSAINILDSLESEVDQKQDYFGPIQGRLKSMNPYDTEGQVLRSKFTAAAQMIGKYLEGGVLRKEDVPKYEAMLPKLGETPAVAKGKLNVVRSLLRQKYETDVGALAGQGYQTSGLPDSGAANGTMQVRQPGTAMAAPASQQESRPSTVIQNGVVYTLNPATGEYE